MSPYRPKTHTQRMRETIPPPPDDRPSAAARGYDHRWREARLRFLAENPLCVHCQQEGRVEPATVVDHIEPHRGDPGKFWSKANWAALCKSHHDRKTARKDGGFGHNRGSHP